jgi:fibronectin type 3 domain-containing protein
VDSPTVIQVSGTGVALGSHSVSLTWNTGDGNAVGYNVYRGTAQNGPFQQINTALDASTNYTDTTVSSGTTYYYVATEVNAQGQESGYSNEVMAVVPSP